MTTTCALCRLALWRADIFSANKRPQKEMGTGESGLKRCMGVWRLELGFLRPRFVVVSYVCLCLRKTRGISTREMVFVCLLGERPCMIFDFCGSSVCGKRGCHSFSHHFSFLVGLQMWRVQLRCFHHITHRPSCGINCCAAPCVCESNESSRGSFPLFTLKF